MNNIARQALRRIIAKHSKDVCGDARRCENLLNDSCGTYVREINVLVTAIEERIPLDLLAGAASTPRELLLSRLEKRLEEQTALTAEAARWSVESWALALDLATDGEIQARQKRTESAPPILQKEKINPNDFTGAKTPTVNRTNPSQTSKTPPVFSPRTNPPVNRQPAQTPKSSSPVIFPTNKLPANQPTAAPIQPTTNQPTIARKGFGIFRGCLLTIFLLAVASVVLFFGVPYAIETMRETQRERNSEPPRFPVR